MSFLILLAIKRICNNLFLVKKGLKHKATFLHIVPLNDTIFLTNEN